MPPRAPPPHPPCQYGIRKIRDRNIQTDLLGVPDDALDGHAFHSYRLVSPDRSVEITFQHNVIGRRWVCARAQACVCSGAGACARKGGGPHVGMHAYMAGLLPACLGPRIQGLSRV